jgi:hypothetical protein
MDYRTWVYASRFVTTTTTTTTTIIIIIIIIIHYSAYYFMALSFSSELDSYPAGQEIRCSYVSVSFLTCYQQSFSDSLQ